MKMVHDLKSLSDEELRALLPPSYDQTRDEGVGRGMRRMRWMNAVRCHSRGEWRIETQEGHTWQLWAAVYDRPLLERCLKMLREDGLKVRAR